MFTFVKLTRLWQQLEEVAQQQDCSPLRLLPRFLGLYGPGRYSPNEIFRLRLLGLPTPNLREFISKERMLGIQRRLNPVDLTSQTEDKALFHRLCKEAGLPVPPVFAELDLSDPVSARSRLASVPEGGLIIKPSLGYHGLGVMLLTHSGSIFTSREGTTRTVDAVLASLAETPGFSHWLVQLRIVNHPEVTAISPSSALQTLRVVTFVGDDGAPHLIASQWRLARPEAVKDNFDAGTGGNWLCNIDVGSGRIAKALQLSPGGAGMESMSHHPVSDVALVDLTPPLWQDVTALALRAAVAMLPTRSIGWDIAVTPDGPMIIEANRYWDPQNMDAGMGARLRFMAARTRRFRYV